MVFGDRNHIKNINFSNNSYRALLAIASFPKFEFSILL